MENNEKLLYVFDFDDTLVDTASSELRVKITHTLPNGRVKTYIKTSDEYASFKLPTTGKIQLNFADFESVPDDIEVKEKYFDLLSNSLSNSKAVVIILTARAAAKPVAGFLKSRLSGRTPSIVAVGTSDPFAKSNYIKGLIDKYNFSHVYYYDDAKKNIDAVETLEDDYPNVEFELYHVLDQ